MPSINITDRCVVYTYYDNLGWGDEETIRVWKRTWAAAGWKPIVLDERIAAAHPLYRKYKAAVAQFPRANGLDYESACYLRHMAMVVVGGGFLTDYDVFNVNLPPPPKCDWLPNHGDLTTHDVFVPAIVTGSADAFDALIRMFMSANVTEVMEVTKSTFVSDQVLFNYFYLKRLIKTRKTGQTAPEHIRDPPCDQNGVEYAPMVFHMSHKMMIDAAVPGLDLDRPKTMMYYYDLLRRLKRKCAALKYDAATYERVFFPDAKEATPLQRSYGAEHLCNIGFSHPVYWYWERPEDIARGFEGIVDKDGNEVTTLVGGKPTPSIDTLSTSSCPVVGKLPSS